MTFFILVLLAGSLAYLLSRIRYLHLAHADDLQDLRAEIAALKRQLNAQPANHSAEHPAQTASQIAADASLDLELINLNSASKNALQRIPKVGAVCAQRVIGARPLVSLEQLDKIDGLTREQREQLKRFGSI